MNHTWHNAPTWAIRERRPRRRIDGLAVFDMDGTLFPETTACQQIARTAGNLDVITDLERDYRHGLINSLDFARRASKAWDAQPPDLYRRAFDACPKIGGIEKTLAWLSARSFATCLITMAPGLFADHFKNFDYVYASTYPNHILNPADKPTVVKRLQFLLKIDDANLMAFGDSDSDLPLFAALTHTVAVNATPNLVDVAARAYSGDALYQALQLLGSSVGGS